MKNPTLKHYNKKLVKSGDILEIFDYEKNIYRGHSYRKNNSASTKKGKKRIDNVARARARLRRIIATNSQNRHYKPIFVTFTWGINETNRKEAYLYWAKYLRRLRNFAPHVKYIYVWEQQMRGAWHIHAIFWDVPRKHIYLLDRLWKRGNVYDIDVDTRDILHVSNYLGKYFGKNSYMSMNERLFSYSLNMEKPQEIIFEYDDYMYLLQRARMMYSDVHTMPTGNVCYYKVYIIDI